MRTFCVPLCDLRRSSPIYLRRRRLRRRFARRSANLLSEVVSPTTLHGRIVVVGDVIPTPSPSPLRGEGNRVDNRMWQKGWRGMGKLAKAMARKLGFSPEQHGFYDHLRHFDRRRQLCHILFWLQCVVVVMWYVMNLLIHKRAHGCAPLRKRHTN